MNCMDRRRFLYTAAVTAGSLKALSQSPASAQPAGITLHPEQPGPAIPENFIGLSYESQQLSDPAYFSPANLTLIARFRELTPQGVLRIGGNTSDVGWWKPSASSVQPPLPPTVLVVPLSASERPFQQLAYSVTPEAVRNLRAFLDATGWKCIYGINLGTSTPARAAEEAAFVARTLGQKLEYFQLGNEPDLFPSRFRDKKTWTVDAYFDEWLAAANAVRERVPGARFGLPDTAGDPAWSSRIAERLATLLNTPAMPHIAAVTHHYYFGGPPSNPEVNLGRLLRPDPRVASVAATTRNAARQLGVPYRMSEGNTCYRGGKPGVSDVLGAALWAAGYLLTLASFGYSGVNLHGGGGKAVADSLGGTLPGELLLPDPNAPHPRPFYTPIAEIGGLNVPEPIFFGMKFAGAFAGASILPVDFDPGPVNAVAFAARTPDSQIILAVINKDAAQALVLDLSGAGAGMRANRQQPDGSATRPAQPRWTAVQTLTAPSLDSHTVTLAAVPFADVSSHSIVVPPASATLFRMAVR